MQQDLSSLEIHFVILYIFCFSAISIISWYIWPQTEATWLYWISIWSHFWKVHVQFFAKICWMGFDSIRRTH